MVATLTESLKQAKESEEERAKIYKCDREEKEKEITRLTDSVEREKARVKTWNTKVQQLKEYKDKFEKIERTMQAMGCTMTPNQSSTSNQIGSQLIATPTKDSNSETSEYF